MLDILPAFGFGVVGAAAPEIARLYKTKSQKFDIHWTNAVISVVFFALGGIVAIALSAPTFYAALFDGVSTPTIISSLAAASSTTTKPTTQIPQPPSPPKLSPFGGIGGLGNLGKGGNYLSTRQYIGVLTGSVLPREQER